MVNRVGECFTISTATCKYMKRYERIRKDLERLERIGKNKKEYERLIKNKTG